MPQFMITSPEGKQFQVTGPEGATQEQALSYAQQNYSGQTQPSASSVMGDLPRQLGLAGRYMAEGATALPSMVGNAANALSNQFLGTNLPSASQGISDLLTKFGFPQPQGPGERIIGDMSRGLASVGGAGIAAKGIAGMADSPMITSLSDYLSSMPKAQGASAVTGSGAAGITREAGGGPVVQTVAGVGGSLVPFMTPGAFGLNKTSTVPVSEDIKQSLLSDNPDVRTYRGEELASQLKSAEQTANTAKETAYKSAEIAGGKSTVSKGTATSIADSIDESLANLDPEQVTSVKSIKKYTQQLRDLGDTDGVTGIKYNTLENLRQRINAIPYKTETAAGIGAARKSFDTSIKSILEDGLINGDSNAIALIKDARAKNAYWRNNFTGDQANSAISKYIESVGGKEEIAPENLLDMFTKVGQTGLNNVKAAKDVLGNSAQPILKHAYLNKIRTASIDADGNIKPAALTKNINAVLNKDPTLAGSIFSADELDALKAMGNIANNFAKNGMVPKGVVTKLMTRVPYAGPLLEEVLRGRVQGQMMNSLQKPSMTTYPTLSGPQVRYK